MGGSDSIGHSVELNQMKFHHWQKRLSNYDVVTTDYDNTALVYSCRNLFLLHYYNAWVLARHAQVNETVVEDYRQLALQVAIALMLILRST